MYLQYQLYPISSQQQEFLVPRYPDSWHCSTDTRKRINLLSHSFHSLFTAQMSLNWKILRAVLWKASNIVHGLMTLAADPSPFMSVKNLPLTSGMVKLDPSNLVFPDFSYSFSLPMPACFSCREESGYGIYSVINACNHLIYWEKL